MLQNRKVMLYVFISLFIVGVFIFRFSIKKSLVNTIPTKGLSISDFHYCSLTMLENGQLLLFANKLEWKKTEKNILTHSNNVEIFSSDDLGRNWVLFMEIEGMECADENSVVIIDNKVFLKVHCDSVNFLKTQKSNILCIDINNKTKRLTSPFFNMSDMVIFDNNVVFSENGTILSLNEELEKSIIAETNLSNISNLVSMNKTLYAYTSYDNYLIDITNNVKHEFPNPIHDVVFCNENEIIFFYSDLDKKLCNARYTLNMNQIFSSNIKKYNYLKGLIYSDSILVGIAKERFNSINEIVYSLNKGETWNPLGIKGNITTPYCISGNSLYVLSCSSNSICINSLSLRNE